jgi:hypothetical protein
MRLDASVDDDGFGCCSASAQFERIQVIICCSAVTSIGDARRIVLCLARAVVGSSY